MRKDKNARKAKRKLIEQTVENVVHSGVLGTSARRATLLRYLVEKELDGFGARIQAFSIAVDVLGRDANFDPGSDSIVRSEVGRLRDALRLFNAEHARAVDICIEIPKGTYRPTFSSPPVETKRFGAYSGRAVAIAVFVLLLAVIASLGLRGPAIATKPGDEQAQSPSALPFEPIQISVPLPDVLGTMESRERVAVGFYTELMMGLSAYPWLSVVAPLQGLEDIDPSKVDYALDGVFYWDATEVEARVRLVSYPDQILIWSDTQVVEHDPSAIREAIVTLSSTIAYRLASGDGIAPELTRVKNTGSAGENMDAYLCYLGLHRYVAMPTDEDHLRLRNCLLDAVENFPEFGDGWAALAIVYVDEARFRTNPRDTADPWADANAAVAKALQYAPLRMTSLNVALINSAEAPTKDLREFDRISGLLLNLFPKHPPTLYNVGSRAAEFLGRWEEGLDLIDQAIELHPNPPSAYYLTRAYHAAMTGTAEEALASVASLTNESSISQLFLNYLAAARSDLSNEQETYRLLLEKRGFSSHNDFVSLVKRRGYVADLETALLAHLEQIRIDATLQ